MANRKISYTTRDFEGIRSELIQYVRTYYPELIQNFNDASVFSVFKRQFFNMLNKDLRFTT